VAPLHSAGRPANLQRRVVAAGRRGSRRSFGFNDLKRLLCGIFPAAAAAMLTACSGPAGVMQAAVDPVDGREIYERDCLACHMTSGRGVPGMTPTLIASPWITGSEDALIGYMLTGGFGSGILMARFDYLDNAEMAAVLSYIRAEYGGGVAPISADRVAVVREQVLGTDPGANPRNPLRN